MKTMKTGITGITGMMSSRDNPAKDNLRDYFTVLNELSARSKEYYAILQCPSAIYVIEKDEDWKRRNVGSNAVEAKNLENSDSTSAPEMTEWF